MIMYACATCYEHCSEACGHADRTELRVLADGMWLCEGCFDELSYEAFGLPADHDGDKPLWSSFPPPPEHVPVAQLPPST